MRRIEMNTSSQRPIIWPIPPSMARMLDVRLLFVEACSNNRRAQGHMDLDLALDRIVTAWSALA